MKIYGVPICEATTLGGKHGGESDMDLAGVGEFGVARGLRQTRKHRLPPCCDGGAGKVPWEVRVGPRTSAGTRERKSLCPTQTVNTNQTYTHTHTAGRGLRQSCLLPLARAHRFSSKYTHRGRGPFLQKMDPPELAQW